MTNKKYQNQLLKNNNWKDNNINLKRTNPNYYSKYNNFAIILWNIYQKIGSTIIIDDINASLLNNYKDIKVNLIGNINILNFILEQTKCYYQSYFYQIDDNKINSQQLLNEIKAKNNFEWNFIALNPLITFPTSFMLVSPRNNDTIPIIQSFEILFPYHYDVNDIYQIDDNQLMVANFQPKAIINIYLFYFVYLLITIIIFGLSLWIIKKKDVT